MSRPFSPADLDYLSHAEGLRMDGKRFDRYTKLLATGRIAAVGHQGFARASVAQLRFRRWLVTMPMRDAALLLVLPRHSSCPVGEEQCGNNRCCPTGTCSGYQNGCCPAGQKPCTTNISGCCCDGPFAEPCERECCIEEDQCCDSECCSPGSLCVARVFDCSTSDCEEICCPKEQTLRRPVLRRHLFRSSRRDSRYRTRPHLLPS